MRSLFSFRIIKVSVLSFFPPILTSPHAVSYYGALVLTALHKAAAKCLDTHPAVEIRHLTLCSATCLHVTVENRDRGACLFFYVILILHSFMKIIPQYFDHCPNTIRV